MASAAPDLGVSPRREGEPSPSPTGKRQIEFAEPPPKEDGFTDLSDVASSPQLARSGTCGSSFGSSHRPPLQRGLTSTGSTGSGALSSFKRQMSGAVCALSAVRRLKLYSREARSMNASKRRATEELSRKGVRQGTVRRSSFTRRRSFAAAADLMSRAMGTRDGQSHSVAAAGLIGQRLRGEELSLRQRLFLILEEPASSVTAYCVSVLIRTLTVGSAAAVTMESLEVLTESTGPHVWLAFAVTFNVCFTVEALVRVACYEPSPLEARHDAFIWLDVLCVVPFWLRVCIDGAAASGEVYLYYGESMISLRVLEAFASFRLLKLCRYYEGAGLLMRAVGRSMEQLYVPLFMVAIMVVVFSVVLYNLEFNFEVHSCKALWLEAGVSARFLREHAAGVTWGCDTCTGSNSSMISNVDAETRLHLCSTCGGFPAGHPECVGVRFGQEFPSIPAAMWYMLVTVTTVGYGDSTPQSHLGQCFMSVVILLGVVFLAMPLSTVGRQFTNVWDERQLLLSENDISPDDCLVAFRQFDTDGNGLIDANEFTFFVSNVLGLRLRKPELNDLWRMIDVNGSGAVNFTEFTAHLFPSHEMNFIDGEQNLKEAAAAQASACADGPSPPFRRPNNAQGLGGASFGSKGDPSFLKAADDGAGLYTGSFKNGGTYAAPRPKTQMAVLQAELKATRAAVATRCDASDDLSKAVGRRVEHLEGMIEKMHATLVAATSASADGTPESHHLRRRLSGGATMEAAAHAASAGNLLGGRRSRLSSFTSMLPTGLGPTTSNKKLLAPGPPATAEPGQGKAVGQGSNPALPGESRGGAAADEAPARPPKERAAREITRGDSFFREANGPAAPADVRPDLGCKSAPGREASRQMATGEGASGGGSRRPVRGPSRSGSRDWVVAAAPAACDGRLDA